MGDLYSVPPTVIFRSWRSANGPVKRRLLLKNGGSRAVAYRITLPQNAFRLAGVPDGAGGTYTLAAGASVGLTVHLQEEHAGNANEVSDEVLLRTPGGVLHVPILALASAEQPKGGEPLAQHSAALADEPAWPASAAPPKADVDSDEELWAADNNSGSAPPTQRSSAPGQRPPREGAAGAPPPDAESAFYSAWCCADRTRTRKAPACRSLRRRCTVLPPAAHPRPPAHASAPEPAAGRLTKQRTEEAAAAVATSYTCVNDCGFLGTFGEVLCRCDAVPMPMRCCACACACACACPCPCACAVLCI